MNKVELVRMKSFSLFTVHFSLFRAVARFLFPPPVFATGVFFSPKIRETSEPQSEVSLATFRPNHATLFPKRRM